MTPEELIADMKGDDKAVTALFPTKVKLNLDGMVVEFPEGLNEIPASLMDHWYLKAHKVRIYNRPQYPKPAAFIATQDHVDFLGSKGYGEEIKTVDEASKFVNALDPSSRETFLKHFDEWKQEKSSGGKEVPPDFTAMNKDKLASYAKEKLGLDLDPRKMNRDDMLAAIEEKLTSPSTSEPPAGGGGNQ